MDKKQQTTTLVSIAVLILLIAVLLGVNSLRRSAHIELADPSDDPTAETGDEDGSAVNRLSVTTATVQKVIATLHRGSSYSRTVTVERFYAGGSGAATVQTAVLGGWTRTDESRGDGSVRHCVTNGETTYIWYGTEKTVYSGRSDAITADAEQGIPTYEEILALETEQIAAADYETYADQSCIFVQTAADGDGLSMRYWVSVGNGLLVAAEQYDGETLVYRMSATDPDSAAPETALFTLPDGTKLLSE